MQYYKRTKTKITAKNTQKGDKGMNKKTIPVLAAVLLLLSLFGNPADAVYAAEDTFEVESTWLPATVAFEPYTARIPMKNGNEGYTFRLVSGYVPAGLNISNKNAAFTQEGIITGRAQGSGRHTLNIEIKNQQGEKKRITFYIHISPIKVRVKVAAPADIVYDGKPHYADVQCYNYEHVIIGTSGENLVKSRDSALAPILFFGKGKHRFIFKSQNLMMKGRANHVKNNCHLQQEGRCIKNNYCREFSCCFGK